MTWLLTFRFGKSRTELTSSEYDMEFDRLLNYSQNEQGKTIGRIGNYKIDGKHERTSNAIGRWKLIEMSLWFFHPLEKNEMLHQELI